MSHKSIPAETPVFPRFLLDFKAISQRPAIFCRFSCMGNLHNFRHILSNLIMNNRHTRIQRFCTFVWHLPKLAGSSMKHNLRTQSTHYIQFHSKKKISLILLHRIWSFLKEIGMLDNVRNAKQNHPVQQWSSVFSHHLSSSTYSRSYNALISSL